MQRGIRKEAPLLLINAWHRFSIDNLCRKDRQVIQRKAIPKNCLTTVYHPTVVAFKLCCASTTNAERSRSIVGAMACPCPVTVVAFKLCCASTTNAERNRSIVGAMACPCPGAVVAFKLCWHQGCVYSSGDPCGRHAGLRSSC